VDAVCSPAEKLGIQQPWRVHRPARPTHFGIWRLPEHGKAPFIWALNGGYYGIRAGSFKNIYLGVDTAQNPRTYIGMFPDVFDPAFASNVDAFASDFNGSSAAGSVFGAPPTSTPPLAIGITTDDGDYTTGFGPGPDGEASQGKIHLISDGSQPSPLRRRRPPLSGPTGAIPIQWSTPSGPGGLLAAKYTTIDALNAAWGSSYTTFDTDGGWPGGSGLLDENGRHQWIGSDPYELSGASARARSTWTSSWGRSRTSTFRSTRARFDNISRITWYSRPQQCKLAPSPHTGGSGQARRCHTVIWVPGGPSYSSTRRPTILQESLFSSGLR